MKYLIDVPPPEGLVVTRGLRGELYDEAVKRNKMLWEEQKRLYAQKLVSGRDVPRCCWPTISPTQGPDDQVCGITDPHMLAFDHIDDDGKEDRQKYPQATTWINAILTGEVDRKRLQILCHNHNNKKSILRMKSGNHTGRPRKVSDEQIRQTLGLPTSEAAKALGVSTVCINHRRRILLDIPSEIVVD